MTTSTALFIFFANQTFRLLHEEGLFVGGTSGLNVHAAYEVAKMMGPGNVIVTALCDTGQVCIDSIQNIFSHVFDVN